jgi:hypothetical protein
MAVFFTIIMDLVQLTGWGRIKLVWNSIHREKFWEPPQAGQIIEGAVRLQGYLFDTHRQPSILRPVKLGCYH